MYSLPWFFPHASVPKLVLKRIIRLLSYSTKCIKHGVGYKGEHDAWGVHDTNTFFVIHGVIFGLFFAFCQTSAIAVSDKVTFWHEVLVFSMSVFTILLIHCFKCYWRVVPFLGEVKGKCGGSPVWKEFEGGV